VSLSSREIPTDAPRAMTVPACLDCVAAGAGDGWALPRPALDDEEGDAVDPALPFVVDAHVHLFDAPLFEAIWRWFDVHGWPIRYKLRTPDVLAFALARGVGHLVALHYAHKPGIARGMNAFMAEVCLRSTRVTGLATVMPGEPFARRILEEAFASGLRGVKLHCHVQCFAPDAPELAEIYETCVAHDVPLVMHAGREPTSKGYRCDPHALCHVDRTAAVLRAYPRLRLAVPHLGADELDGYLRLLERHDNLWLDTTMTLAGYFDEGETAFRMVEARPERIMYGTDFPNLPYAWDRELRRIRARSMPDATLAQLLGDTARGFYRIAAHRLSG
jgi:predicted TIM-barrel fold metal-dependent hydrolase